jgi:hypothetical protein
MTATELSEKKVENFGERRNSSIKFNFHEDG